MTADIIFCDETGIIKLTNSIGVEQINFNYGYSLYINVEDSDRNLDENEKDTILVSVLSETEILEEPVWIKETGNNTGIFRGNITFEESEIATNLDNILQIQRGEKITGIYIDPSNDFNIHFISLLLPFNYI